MELATKRLWALLSWIIMAIILSTKPFLAECDCNACSANTNTACISENEYRQCDNNEAFGKAYECNQGYVCSVLGGCTKLSEFTDCRQCKKCDATKTFACLDRKTFALCLGKTTHSEITGQCTADLRCNINDSKICGTKISTCSYRDDPEIVTTTEAPTTTTPSPATNPNGFCQLLQKEGRFPVGKNPETTCRQYVNCIKIGTTWYGPIYNCPGQTYFDSSQNNCVVDKPSLCAGAVAQLVFRNIIIE